MAAEDSVAKVFTKAVISPIATSQTRPTYASLCIAQSELSSNAALVHSNLGSGLHGHLALTLTTPEYLALSHNISFVPPANSPAQPVHVAGATAPDISEADRLHLSNQKVFKMYHNVDKALQNQIIVALPEIYIHSLKHTITGYGSVSCLTLLIHLWKNYGTITQPELDENEKRMQLPWMPPTPTKVLFPQLKEGVTFAAAGGEALSENNVM
jgi:hypothetical protein